MSFNATPSNENNNNSWSFVLIRGYFQKKPAAYLLLLLIAGAFAFTSGRSQSASPPAGGGTVTGQLNKWYPLTISFAGPEAAETDDSPNPFLDYRLIVTFTSPGGTDYAVPGYFAGDGQGGGTGSVWRVHFSPNAAGQWHYTASFQTGKNAAISLLPNAGVPTSFDGAGGSIQVGGRISTAPGFLRWGRLAYNGHHYLKFVDGPYWIKGGTNSPENFLGYKGFDNTFDQGGEIPDFLHEYPGHVADWQPGDPNFSSSNSGYDGKGIIGALNYLSEQRVNAIYFLPMNLGGDGQETYPFIGPNNTVYDKTHYDISKLHQWGIVLDHAQRKGIAIQFVLAETETLNELWLDNGFLGVERKLFFRELIARFGHLLSIKWNLSEENDYPVLDLRFFADYIQALDVYDHPIAVHTHLNQSDDYILLAGDPRFSATSWQYTIDSAGQLVEAWRENSANAGRHWVVDMDENGLGLDTTNADALRRIVLYDVYFSGGNIEWYAGAASLPVGGDLNLEDFSTREAMWKYTWYARKFMLDYLPFWQMEPADDLLTGEADIYGGGEVFALPGSVYAIYLPASSPAGSLNLNGVSGTLVQRWYNPRLGRFEGSPKTINGGASVILGNPPNEIGDDWVVLIRREPTFTFFSYQPITPLIDS